MEGVKRPHPSKRDSVPVRDLRPKSQRVDKGTNWGAYADKLERQVGRIDAEIGELLVRGQTENDIPVLALKHRRKQLLSHIGRYRSMANRL